MKLIDILHRSAMGLKSAWLRTALTAMAIAVGGFTLCLTLGLGNGVRNYTDSLVLNNFDPADLFVGRDAEVANTGTPNSTPQEYDESVGSFQSPGGEGSFQIKQINEEDITLLESFDFTEEVRESFSLNMRYITSENGKKLTGSIEPFNPAQQPDIMAGVIGETLADGQIIVPDVYLEGLGFSDADAAIGQKVSIVAAKAICATLFEQQRQAATESATNKGPDHPAVAKEREFNVVGTV